MKLTMSYAVIAVLALCACGEPAPAPTETASPSPDPTAASPTPTDTETDAALAPPLVPEAEKGEKGARNVLLAWARAVENKRFGEAYAQFGEGGPQNGMSAAEYATQFGRCRKITVALSDGQMEGAAGSSYYTAPTTLSCELVTGNTEKWTGDAVLRRVNDVPGASAAQLRWHMVSADLKAS